MRKILVALLLIFNASNLLALETDTPQEGEAFSSFFARITRGGQFPGIYLEAPETLQNPFLKRIRRNEWVGIRNQVYRKLQSQGVDLWGDWYASDRQFDVILNTPEKLSLMTKSLELQIQEDSSQCALNCPKASDILRKTWSDLSSFERQAFAKAYVLKAALFGGRTLASHLAAVYHFPVEQVLPETRIRILSDKDFVQAVHEAGYEGPVYFRGLTVPDPKNPKGHLILLNEEMLFKYSPFDRPVLQTLEIEGILLHEISHVFQDSKGASLGLDVQVRSAEAALLIEGSAEFMAELAMKNASSEELGSSALELFAAEQAVEIVFREGNSESGRLFPYTVGLPFAAALEDSVGLQKHDQLNQKILEFLGGSTSLKDWLQQDFFQRK